MSDFVSRPTLFGRYQTPEAPSALFRTHFHDGTTTLKEVDHEPKNGVLDQEDLLEQGIRVSTFIPGATDVDALGSCTANATASALSVLLSQQEYLAVTGAASYDDVVSIEKWAITFYNKCTHQTGNTAQEWPPTDCGSSGPDIVTELQNMKLASGDVIATGAQNIVSLMQAGPLLVGQPFLNAWMQPDSNGFIDGNGSLASLLKQIKGGVAGGHETVLSAVEKLVLNDGVVDPDKTVIRFRNSWTKNWGDNGSYHAHLSTYALLAQYCDFRRLTP